MENPTITLISKLTSQRMDLQQQTTARTSQWKYIAEYAGHRQRSSTPITSHQELKMDRRCMRQHNIVKLTGPTLTPTTITTNMKISSQTIRQRRTIAEITLLTVTTLNKHLLQSNPSLLDYKKLSTSTDKAVASQHRSATTPRRK